MQGRQRGAQVVRHTGHGFTVSGSLFVFTLGLGFNALRQGVESGLDGPHLVAAHGRPDSGSGSSSDIGIGIGSTRVGAPAVGMHAAGHLAQRLCQTAEGEGPQQPRHQQRHQRAGGQAQAGGPHAGLRSHRFAGRAVKHHVQIAGRAGVAGARREHRGAEDTLWRGAWRVHRVGAAQRQRGALQEAAHGVQVHLVLPHHAGFTDVMRHTAIGVQQVGVHTRVDDHQHAQQGRAFGLLCRRGCGCCRRCVRFRLCQQRPLRHDVPRQPMRQPLQGLLFLLERHLPAQHGHHRAVAQQQQHQRAAQAGGEGLAHRVRCSRASKR